jgi:hypothetical protein
MAFKISDLAESLGSIYLQGETLKTQRAQLNSASDFEKRESGVDSDGSTIMEGQLVSGVNNAGLVGAVVGLVALVVVVVATGK